MARKKGKATLFECLIAVYALSKIKPLIWDSLGRDSKYRHLYTGDKQNAINAYASLNGIEKRRLNKAIVDAIDSGRVSEIDIVKIQAQMLLDELD